MKRVLCLLTIVVVAGTALAEAKERVVTQDAVAIRMAVLEQTMGVTGAVGRSEALKQLQREELLLELAVREGVAMSDDYVRDRVQDMRTMAETDGDSAFADAARTWGMGSVDQFVTDSRVLSLYRRALTIGEMRLRVIERLQHTPTLEPESDDSVDRYLALALYDVSVRGPDVEIRMRE